MHKHPFLLPLVILCSVLVLAQEAMNNESVAKMIKAGLSEDIIVATISSSPGSYNTSADALIALKTAGAGDKVISAILIKSSSAGAAASAPAPGPAPAVQEPELIGKLFYLNPDTKALTQLPGEQWKRKVKGGFATVKTEDIVAGEHSRLADLLKGQDCVCFQTVP